MSAAFTIPSFSLPAVLAKVGARLPQWPHAVALCTALNAAARFGFLPADSLDMLEGKVVLIDVTDTGGQALFTWRDGLFRPLLNNPPAPDLIFRAKLSAYLQLLARQEDPDTLFFNRQLSIEGDTELGLTVKNLLDAVEWPSLPALPKLPLFAR